MTERHGGDHDAPDRRHDVPVHELDLGRGTAALLGVQAGLGRLRGLTSAAALLTRATEEACRGCGFSRSILCRVVNDRMVPVSAHFGDDPDGASAFLAAVSAEPPRLTHLLPEAEMMRLRRPTLVRDVAHDPRVHRAFTDAWATSAYIAAPIMPEGKVIGFLHADRAGQPTVPDECDRNALWTFAEGVGFALMSVVLGERLRAQRAQVRDMLTSTEQLVGELLVSEVEAGRVNRDDPGRTDDPATGLLLGVASRLEQLLTPREIDVIRLLAAGETNAGAASRLMIAEGTVKSHVKHILRKLRAANRAEAVSRYLRITALDGSE